MLPVCNYLKQNLIKNGFTTQYEIVPNVVDTSIFHVKTKKKKETIKFLHISSLNFEQKNIVGILRTLVKLKKTTPKFSFYFGGEGTKEEMISIQKFIEKSDLLNEVRLLGNLTSTEVAYYMQQADCFVLFSNYENQPCVIVESFACGLPVIATNVGGISEFLPTNFGFLIQPSNERQLLNAKENFSQAVIAQKFSSIYELV